MSQTAHQDLERGDHTNDQPDEPLLTLNQPSQPSREETNYGDGSWPLYSMYFKIAEEADGKKAELKQKDSTMILPGLFSATVAALLSVSIQDLKPNSQDISAFYLEKIYQLNVNTNTSHGSPPPTLATPPAFYPPRYVVYVNLLWLLALFTSLYSALMATLDQRYTLRHIAISQNQDHIPETRARVHAMMNSPDSGRGRFAFRQSELMPNSLHQSFFLFVVGVLVYIYNINRIVFHGLAGAFIVIACEYTFLTFSPLYYTLQLSYTPFTPLALHVYLKCQFAAYQVCSWIKPLRGFSRDIRRNYRDLRDRYSQGFLEGRSRLAEELASEPSSAIDTEILERMLFALDEDHALEAFFGAIPGFCDSKLVQKPLDSRVTAKLQQSLDGFLDRTFSSHLVTESARNDRLITCLNAAHSALGPSAVSQILGDFFSGPRDEGLKSVGMGHVLRRWGHSSDDSIEPNVRRIVACIIARAQDRDDQWAMLGKEVFGVPDRLFQDYLAHGDSVLLAILIHVACEALRTGRVERDVLESLSRFDIHNTLPELRHDFCNLWNSIIQEATNGGEASDTATQILAEIHPLFSALHQDTDAESTLFSGPTGHVDDRVAVLSQTNSYPRCNIPSHHPCSAAYSSAITSPTVPPSTQPSDSPQVSPRPTLASQPLLAVSSDLATEHTMPGSADASVISHTTDRMHSSTSSAGPSLQHVEETRIIPPPAIFGSLPATPGLNGQIQVHPGSSVGSAVTHTDYIPDIPTASSSTSTTAPLSGSPHVTTISDQYPDTNEGAAGARDDTQGPRPPISGEDYRQLSGGVNST